MDTFTPDNTHPDATSEHLPAVPEGADKRAYERPSFETVGSIPRLTGGSDIFGDMTAPS